MKKLIVLIIPLMLIGMAVHAEKPMEESKILKINENLDLVIVGAKIDDKDVESLLKYYSKEWIEKEMAILKDYPESGFMPACFGKYKNRNFL